MSSWSDGNQINTDGDVVGRLGMKPATYIFWLNGSDYEAVDTYGKIAYGGSGDAGGADGADGSAVLQAAHDALTSGGKIFVRNGTHYLTTDITVTNDYVTIEGESPNAVITQAASTNCTWFFNVTGTHFRLANIRLEGDYANNASTGGVQLQSTATDAWIYNNFISHFYTYGLRADANRLFCNANYINESDVPMFFGAADSHIIGNEIGGACNYGNGKALYLSSAGSTTIEGNKLFTAYSYLLFASSILRCTIVGNIMGPSSDQDGIYLSSNSSSAFGTDNIIADNYIYSCNDAAIRVHGQYSLHNQIKNNTIYDCDYGIVEVTNADYTHMQGNVFRSITTADIAPIGAHSTIRDCAGYDIEHHTAADTLTVAESGTVHTNLGATGNIKLTLPQDAIPGVTFEFAVMTAAQQLQVDAGAAGALYIGGAKSADDAYAWADDEGESVKFVADGNGDWVALYTQGTWTVV